MNSLLFRLTRHPVGLLGAALALASLILFLVLFGIEAVGFQGGPYLGILTFIIIPAIFVLGLILMPIGLRLDRRRQERHQGDAFPVIDLNRPTVRRAALAFVGATVVNLGILAIATYKGVEVMDSTEFCGETCHSVMSPEFTTYQRSPHSRVNCVDCHIGPGAGWFVKSKLSGSWQLVSVALDLYPTPIPTPVHNLRPARDTCEQCHWPEKFVGDRLVVKTHYEEDEANTPLKSVVVLRIGGVAGRQAHGIHWHVDPANEIRYLADESRSTIHTVEMRDASGGVKRFRAPDAHAEADGEWRTMDCIDCHNRPSHIYKLPGTEMDLAFDAGQLPSDLPYLKREGMRLLQGSYASHEEAREKIPAGLAAFYVSDDPAIAASRADDIGRAGRKLAEIWCTNIHPAMNITWGTYPSHIGHEDFPGCFRCHDDQHAAEDGSTISQDCSTCHTLLAIQENNPPILADLNP